METLLGASQVKFQAMSKSDDEEWIPPPPKLLRETTSSYDHNVTPAIRTSPPKAGPLVGATATPDELASWSPVSLRYIAGLDTPEINRITRRTNTPCRKGYSPLPLCVVGGDPSLVAGVAGGDDKGDSHSGTKRSLSFGAGLAHFDPSRASKCNACGKETSALVLLYEQYERGIRCYKCAGITTSLIDWGRPRPTFNRKRRRDAKGSKKTEEDA
jgi:hypothetical protein